MSILKALVLLGTYWTFSAYPFIWIPLSANGYCWVRILLVNILLPFILIALIISINFFEKFRIKEWVVLIPILISLVGTSLILWLMDAIVTKFIVLSIITSIYIGVFLFLQFYENVTQSSNKNIDLIHIRYLEYGRSFFWVIVIVLVSYLAWEIQIFNLNDPAEQSFPFEINKLWEALLLFWVVAVGFGIVFLGFHYNLHEIENIKKR